MTKINDDECPCCLTQVYTSGLSEVGPLTHLIRSWKNRMDQAENEELEQENKKNKMSSTRTPSENSQGKKCNDVVKSTWKEPEILFVSSSSSDDDDGDDVKSESGTVFDDDDEDEDDRVAINNNGDENDEETQMTQVLVSQKNKQKRAAKALEKIRQLQQDEQQVHHRQRRIQNDNTVSSLTPKMDITKNFSSRK